jgi:Protein of unknown function (DUF3237)
MHDRYDGGRSGSSGAADLVSRSAADRPGRCRDSSSNRETQPVTTHRPLHLAPVATLKVTVGEPIHVGAVREGQRRIIPITGGRVEGPALAGEVLPGGADWQVVRSDGGTRVWARYDLRTDDGVVLTVTNTGVFVTVDGRREAVTSVAIEAPDGAYGWLNDAVLVGSATPWPQGPGVSLAFYRAEAVNTTES